MHTIIVMDNQKLFLASGYKTLVWKISRRMLKSYGCQLLQMCGWATANLLGFLNRLTQEKLYIQSRKTSKDPRALTSSNQQWQWAGGWTTHALNPITAPRESSLFSLIFHGVEATLEWAQHNFSYKWHENREYIFHYTNFEPNFEWCKFRAPMVSVALLSSV